MHLYNSISNNGQGIYHHNPLINNEKHGQIIPKKKILNLDDQWNQGWLILTMAGSLRDLCAYP